jgi:hypothetical protein
MSKRSEGEEVDCTDKKCFLVHQLRQVCVIDLPTNNSLCQIPCIMEGCVTETHRSILCPIWICEPHPTSTTSSTSSSTTSTTTSTTSASSSTTSHSTTTSTMTTHTTTTSTQTTSTTSLTPTTSPPIPVPLSCHSVVLYLSIGLNFLLIIGLLVLIFKYLKLKREDMQFEEDVRRSLQPSAPPTVDRLTGQVGHFSLGSLENLLGDERQPLLGNTSHRNQLVRGAGFQSTVSNESSVSDETFLRHRTEYVFMKTFKPQAEERKRIDESSV